MMLKCGACGTIAQEGAKFCRKCGKKFTQFAEEHQPLNEGVKVRICSKCGAKITLPNARFCRQCGLELPKNEEKDTQELTCSCGAKIEKEWKFCKKCGKKITIVPKPQDVVPEKPPEPEKAPERIDPWPQESKTMDQFFSLAGDL